MSVDPILGAESSRQAPLIRRLLEPRPWGRLIPDAEHELVTTGYFSWKPADYVAAALGDDGNFALAYLPSPRPVTADLSQLRGPVRAQWFDPTNGKYQDDSASPLRTAGRRQFAPPNSSAVGGHDSVLALETAGHEDH